MSGDLILAANAGLAALVLVVILLLWFRVGSMIAMRSDSQLEEALTGAADRIERVFRDEGPVRRIASPGGSVVCVGYCPTPRAKTGGSSTGKR